MKTCIKVFTTGGTIDKSYDEIHGRLKNIGSRLQDFVFGKLRLPYTEITVEEIMFKDSLRMTEDDRQIICQKVEEYAFKSCPIIVIHGTDTMEVTAKYCFENIKDPQVPIVFTGSMVPIGFIDSDGNQNIAEAVLACKLLPPGFYISFHSEIFKVPNVTKLKKKGTFGKLKES